LNYQWSRSRPAACLSRICGTKSPASPRCYHADGDTELDGLFVEPNLWRLGIGRALVLHCEFAAAAAGATALHVVGNPQAAEFYAACGFDIAGEHQTRFGPALAWKKTLAVQFEA
jgi:GNAT superfamily N-acetyltransferase